MASQIDDRRRLVVPRWRPFRISAGLGELNAATQVRVPKAPEPGQDELRALLDDWTRDKNPASAAGLVDAALVFGKPEIGVDAAEWLLTNGGVSDVSLTLARQVLSKTSHQLSGAPFLMTTEERCFKISGYRKQLRKMPRDPLLWVDLAREYSILGQPEPASEALRRALALSPGNRFVVRSASRFYLHIRDFDRAHDVLLRAPSLNNDPWLIAAEIVSAQARDKTSRLIRKGRRLLESGHYLPRHVSELASAIGTIEHSAGDWRQVRRLFERALLDPTENAVAQAAWVERHMHNFTVPNTSLSTPRAFEARAWDAVRHDDFGKAVQLSKDWLSDEPFSTRPAFFGSWVAFATLGDYRGALEIMESSAPANPGNPRVIAQILYCKASSGDVEAAAELMPVLERKIRINGSDRSTVEWDVLLHADRGLIAFRRGNLTEGRYYYQTAIDLATNNKLTELAASAFIHLAREEVRVNPSVSLDKHALKRSVDVFPSAVHRIMSKFVQRILETPPSGVSRL